MDENIRNSPRNSTPSPNPDSPRHVYYFQRKKGNCYIHRFNDKINLNFVFIPANIMIKIAYLCEDNTIHESSFSNKVMNEYFFGSKIKTYAIKIALECIGNFKQSYNKNFDFNITFLRYGERYIDKKKTGKIKCGVDNYGKYSFFLPNLIYTFDSRDDYLETINEIISSFEVEMKFLNN